MSPKEFEFWCQAACTLQPAPAMPPVKRELVHALNETNGMDVLNVLGVSSDYGSGPVVAPWRAALFARTVLLRHEMSPEARELLTAFLALCEL